MPHMSADEPEASGLVKRRESSGHARHHTYRHLAEHSFLRPRRSGLQARPTLSRSLCRRPPGPESVLLLDAVWWLDRDGGLDGRRDADDEELRQGVPRLMRSLPSVSRIPDFFIVGAPRSGTSALFDHLGAHPQIFVPRVKEPMFFGADQEFLFRSQRRMSLDEYLALFADAGDAVRIGEGSTTYLYSRSAPSEIRESNPDARIIIMLRDPVAVMHAQHSIAVWKGFEPIADFWAALEAQDRERAGNEVTSGRSPRQDGPYYRDIVDYANHVGRYLDTFGREQVHVLVFDDWVADMPGTYRRTLEFLEVDPSFVANLRVVNPNRRVRSRAVHRLIAEPPIVIRRTGSALLPARVRRKLQRGLVAVNTRVAPREVLDPVLLARLRTEFTPTIDRLAALIGRDLSAWTVRTP